MKTRRSGRSRRSQAGFLMIEVMMSIALTALLGLGAAAATAQVCTQTSQNSDYTAASREAMNVIAWMGEDAQTAQTVTGAGTFPESSLVFSHTSWDNTLHTVTYSLSSGQLTRTTSSGNVTVVGNNIVSSDTSCTMSGNVLTITVTAKIDNASVTKSREAVPRPSL